MSVLRIYIDLSPDGEVTYVRSKPEGIATWKRFTVDVEVPGYEPDPSAEALPPATAVEVTP